jgi:DUF2946 family protein
MRSFRGLWRFKRTRNVFDSAGRHPYITGQDSNIPLKNVTRELHNGTTRPHSAIARVLSLLLLGFIVYGTTVEAAHTHGNLKGPTNTGSLAVVSDPANTTDSNGNLQSCGDCLICQLHQNFAATLISVPPTAAPSILSSLFSSVVSASFHSQTSTPRRGRAPPQTS